MVDWQLVREYFPEIVAKFPITLKMVLISISLGLLLGFIQAIIRINKVPVLNQLALVQISYIRCTPIITQLYVIYFGVPILLSSLGFDVGGINKEFYAILAYTLNQAAFLGENIRSSIQAVPKGQFDAGRSVGMTEAQTLLSIVTPQALYISLPMLGTFLVALFQGTALAYLVGVTDMMGKVKLLGAKTGHTLEGYIVCAIVFALISIILEQVFRILNSKLDFANKKEKNNDKTALSTAGGNA